MHCKNLLFAIIVILLMTGCSLPLFQNAQQTPPPAGNPSQPGTDIQKSFPLTSDTQMASPDFYNPNNPSGSFIIKSRSSLDALIKYYAQALAAQGWTLRDTDANFTGGVTQYWKKDNLYLSMDFGFGVGLVTIHCLYDRVESKYAQKLPKDFPLPGKFEMVKAQATSWELYIPQDYAVVTNNYTKNLTSMNWKQAATSVPVLGSCGEIDCGSGEAALPAGAKPTATVDPRQSNELSFSMPDGNLIELTITPHQNGTIMDINLILKNIQSAGLPQDVPIYPGALVQTIAPGSAEFQINTDMKTIENYYIDKLNAAGWAADGAPREASGSYLQNWKKGDQNISITLVPSGTNTGLVIVCPTCLI
jgi:hypothetical protein